MSEAEGNDANEKMLMGKKGGPLKESEAKNSCSRNTGSQGTNKVHLLLADFFNYQYRRLKEMT